MSGHYDPNHNIPLPEMMDQGYPTYDNYHNPYSRLAGPPSHYDGVAFWYRPNNEPIYDRDALLYEQGISMPGSNMEATNVKHRRTRSGCYTCRSRRVKCDEARPICERCRKGGRECEFPQASSSSKRVKHAESRSPQESSKSPTNPSGLDSIKDESEPEDKPVKASRRPTLSNVRTHSSHSVQRKRKNKASQDNISPSTAHQKASPQSSTSSNLSSRGETPASSFHTSARSAEIQARQAKIKSLKPDMQKYLQFQRDHMTHYHYFFKLDPTDFIHNEFIDQALSFEPLLHAAVGFAAYHYELRQAQQNENGDANLSAFLNHHSRALVLLRKSLEKHTSYTPAMLLTVLQLATVEEYLGDWVNLVGHHKAGYTMLTTLYTPISMAETDLTRRIFSWFARLDLIAGLMGGSSTRLDRPWFEANTKYFSSAVDRDPDNDLDIEGLLADFVGRNRLVGFDMASLCASMSQSLITPEQFQTSYAEILARLSSMKREIEAMNDGFYTVTHYPAAATNPYNPEVDIVDPYIPGGLFKEALWNLNFMWIDWYAIEQMTKYQASLLTQQPPPPELADISIQQCRIYEAIDRYPDAPEGAILGAHASLGLATVFLQKDDKHTMWARRKMADIESLGYVFPQTYRVRMAHLWGLSKEQVGEEECVEDWWLPNGEGKLPILGEIRRIVAERHASEGGEAILKENLQDVRDLKAIFAKLDLRTQGAKGAAGEELSPASESARSGSGSASASVSGVHSPSSATSLGREGSISAVGADAWSLGSVGSQGSASTVVGRDGKGQAQGKGKGKGKVKQIEEEEEFVSRGDRMSGVWST